MAYSLDPNRPTPWKVIDNFDEVGREGIYSGSLEDCQEFLSEQPDCNIAGMYDIKPNYAYRRTKEDV